MARTLFLLILCLHPLFSGEQFWFSYKNVTANSIVVFEQKHIASAMLLSDTTPLSVCTIELSYLSSQPKETFLQEHFDTLLPCFYRFAVHVLGRGDKSMREQKEHVELVIEPVKFTVEFKDEFATIKTFR